MTAPSTEEPQQASRELTLFVAGDVMTGRGIDQILPHPGDPRIMEPYVRSALDYVQLAERANGPIPRGVDFDYIWGDALPALDQAAPDLRIINLETAVTRSGAPWPGKGIQYRMHPENVQCLLAAGIDCCVLANNHVLDWGYAGLDETLDTLANTGVKTVGAGKDHAAAAAPARLKMPGGGDVLVFAYGTRSSGIPAAWAASAGKAGVNQLADLAETGVRSVANTVRKHRRAGDRVVVSLHWGGNWGYAIPQEHIRFAHALIDSAGVDLIHGHSSHHPLGMEIYRSKTVLYGCGDLLDDYEGIRGHEEFRIDLALMYLVTLERASGNLLRLEMIPMRRRQFRLQHANPEDTAWLAAVLDRESRRFNVQVETVENGSLRLQAGKRTDRA